MKSKKLRVGKNITNIIQTAKMAKSRPRSIKWTDDGKIQAINCDREWNCPQRGMGQARPGC